MDLREFSQSTGYSTVILTTYEFDPVFFERLVLRDLILGGVRTVVVLADSSRAMPAINRMADDLLHLGRRYQLFPVLMQGAFHPKLAIKLGAEGALVACGSANITQSGWLGQRPNSQAGNREVAAAWRVLPSTPQATDLIRVLNSFSRLSTSVRQQLDSVVDQFSWLSESTAIGDSSLLMSSAEETLSTQILKKLQGRKFNRAVIQTGSTDKVGAFLRWLHEHFGIQRAVVELDPAYSIFDPQALGGLPFEVRVRQSPSRPRLHAKVVVLEGGQDTALIYGSANCSAAAWILPLGQRGNSEAVVCLDQVDTAVLKDVLDLSDSDTVPSTEVEYSGDSEIKSQECQAIYVIHASYSPESKSLRWVFSEPVNESQISSCVLSKHDLVPHAMSEKEFQAEFTGDSLKSDVQFISLVVSGVKIVHWVDNQDALDRFRDRSHNMPRPPKSPADPDGDPKEVIDGLRIFAKWLLDYNVQHQYVKIQESRLRRTRKDQDIPQQNLTIDDIIGSISDHQPRSSKSNRLRSFGTLSAHGVIGMILGDTNVQHDEDDEDSITRELGNDRNANSGTTDHSGDEKRKRQVRKADRNKLLRQVQRFIKIIESDEFALCSTLEQLQQAIALPLMMATACLSSDWVETAEERKDWVDTIRTTVELAVTRKCLQSKETLLNSVITRHCDGASYRHKETVGDGTLLVLILAAIETCSNDFDEFERLLLMHDLHRSLVTLTSGCDANRLGLICERLRVPCLPVNWRKQAASALENAKSLQNKLTQLSEVESEGDPASRTHQGDWLWHPTFGFALITMVEISGKVSLRFRESGEEKESVFIRSRHGYQSKYLCLGDLDEFRGYIE